MQLSSGRTHGCQEGLRPTPCGGEPGRALRVLGSLSPVTGNPQMPFHPGFLLTQSRKPPAQGWFYVYWFALSRSRGAVNVEHGGLTRWPHAVFLRLLFWRGTHMYTPSFVGAPLHAHLTPHTCRHTCP